MSNPIAYTALTAQELAAVLAGLRLLQHHTNLPDGIEEILADAGPVISSEGIDALCQRLNSGTPPADAWVAVISHEHGANLYAASSLELATGIVFDYVRGWWTHEIPTEPVPDNRDEAISRYFELVECEWYLIEQIPISTLQADESEEAAHG